MGNESFNDDLDSVLQTESGRRIIWHIIEEAEKQVFYSKPTVNAYCQGRRSVGYDLLNAIRRLYNGPDYEMQMRMEARAQPETQKNHEDDIYKNTYE